MFECILYLDYLNWCLICRSRGAAKVDKANLRMRRPSSSSRLFSRIAAWDAAWGGMSPAAAYLLRDGTIYHAGSVGLYCGISLLASLLVFQWFETSSPLSRFFSMRDAFGLLKACMVVAALAAAAVFSFSRLEDAPRSIPVLHCILLGAGLLAERLLARVYGTRRDANVYLASRTTQYVLIIGASRLAWLFSKMVEELALGEYQIVAILDAPQLVHRSLNGYPIIGVPTDLDNIIADYSRHGVHIDKVVLAVRLDELSMAAQNKIKHVCTQQGIDLEILPERLFSAEPVADAVATRLPPGTASGVDAKIVAQPSLDRPFWKLKRAIDFAIALVLSVLLAPVALVVCALAFIDVGIPIIFWQQRVGRNRAPLFLYKFRTLRVSRQGAAKTNDPLSPSRIGEFLRGTRLDELPQLWSVLSGDMSLIGPRPLLPIDQPKEATSRLQVRPGLSGWAQVCGGNLVSIEEKSALDAWYIRHASLQIDAIIMLRTLWMLLTRERRNEKAISAALRFRSAEHRCLSLDFVARDNAVAREGIPRVNNRASVASDQGEIDVVVVGDEERAVATAQRGVV
jgi:lipopolysaccharide/colanic/teichoic acid biosynthesis glycosyltransferase